MGSQVVGAKWLRKLSAITGEDVVRGVTHGGYYVEFRTAEHVHGVYYMKGGAVVWVHPDDEPCWSSCHDPSVPPLTSAG